MADDVFEGFSPAQMSQIEAEARDLVREELRARGLGNLVPQAAPRTFRDALARGVLFRAEPLAAEPEALDRLTMEMLRRGPCVESVKTRPVTTTTYNPSPVPFGRAEDDAAGLVGFKRDPPEPPPKAPFPARALRDQPGEAPLIEWV